MFATPLFMQGSRNRNRGPRSALRTRLERAVFTNLGPLYRYPAARRIVSRLLIDKYGKATSPRPRALSMASDYTSWNSLTDRSYSGRHLPPITGSTQRLPSETDVTELFRRTAMRPSSDSSVTFGFFAQWFTDSFLRTSRGDFRKTSSNHEIDLCQLYGLSRDKTERLRAHRGGRMKSQLIEGEEFPPFLYERDEHDGYRIKWEFDDLHDRSVLEVLLAGFPEERKSRLFAVGLEYGNSTIGHTILNTIFLREHNRVAAVLEAEHPDWDDDRLFETTRNILIVELLKIVIEDYIQHIGPETVPIELVPFAAEKKPWNRTNWIAIEFDLLYRWHSLPPDAIGDITPNEFLANNQLVLDRGIEALVTLCSRTAAGRIGLRNTPSYLMDPPQPGVPSVQARTTALMRKARLQPFNEYRKAFGLRPLRCFDELTADPELQRRLAELYGGIENLEWYVGLFAEDHPPQMMMGELLGTMVGYDAFTQALTNPLLARNVFNANTFTQTGLDIIAETHRLQQLFDRNARPGARARFRRS